MTRVLHHSNFIHNLMYDIVELNNCFYLSVDRLLAYKLIITECKLN